MRRRSWIPAVIRPCAKNPALSEDLPIVIEIVDAEEKINEFLPVLDAMMGSGLLTLEKVKVLRYGTDSNLA